MACPKVRFGNVPVEVLRENLSFNLETGIIRWAKKGFKRKLGGEAGWVCNGYRQITLNYQTVLAHRAIWAVFHGEWPAGMIDHADGNPLNNSIANLRIASPVENSINKKMQRNNTSGFTGVTFHQETRKWQARINRDRKKTCLGLFATPEEAAAAYQSAAMSIHGEFARAK